MTLNHDRPLFNLSVAACRRVGSVGGRRSAQNRKLRQTSPVEEIHVLLETAAEAIAILDALFPWLRGAERRVSR
jgi:hypothetical protein